MKEDLQQEKAVFELQGIGSVFHKLLIMEALFIIVLHILCILCMLAYGHLTSY